MATCRVAGCNKPSDGYSPYCSTHRRRMRRHGAPTQTTITAAHLKVHRAAIKRWLDGRPAANGWEPLRTLFGHLVDASEAELGAAAGRASPRYHRQAHEDILKVAKDGPPAMNKAVLTVAAMFLMRDKEPRRFESDDAFRVQLARQYRMVSDVNVAESWSHTDGKVKRVYRDAASRRLVTLGQLLSVGLGALSLAIIKTMAEEADRVAKEKRDAFERIREIAPRQSKERKSEVGNG